MLKIKIKEMILKRNKNKKIHLKLDVVEVNVKSCESFLFYFVLNYFIKSIIIIFIERIIFYTIL